MQKETAAIQPFRCIRIFYGVFNGLARKNDGYGCALVSFAGGADKTVMILNDFFTHGQPNSGAAIVVSAVQSLENDKDGFRMFLVKANTVVRETQL